MKLIVALLVTASLVACGGKAKKNATPDNKGTTEEVKTDGTGGSTYGTQTPPASGEPAPAPAP